MPHLDAIYPKVRNAARTQCTWLLKAPKHKHDAVRDEYHGIVYAESLEVARRAREAFLLKWKKQCP
jgi:hypothetical protein